MRRWRHQVVLHVNGWVVSRLLERLSVFILIGQFKDVFFLFLLVRLLLLI